MSSSYSDYDSGYNSSSSLSSYSDPSTKFYESVVDTTLAARERRKKGHLKRLLKRNDYINKVYDAIFDLTDDILADWKKKVVHAAAYGYSNVNIYEYSKGDCYQDLPVVMLMVGPRDDHDFFERNGIFSVIDEIKFEIGSQRFRVNYKYIGNGTNVINIDWKSGLFDAE
jgi:hypothetical protein